MMQLEFSFNDVCILVNLDKDCWTPDMTSGETVFASVSLKSGAINSQQDFEQFRARYVESINALRKIWKIDERLS